jgi:hypothetical protein
MPITAPLGAYSLTPGVSTNNAIADFNGRVSSTATAVPAGFDMRGFGPPLGPVLPASERPNTMIAGCFAPGHTPTLAEVRNVRSAMSCAGCHDGKTMAGPLTAPLGPGDFQPPGILKGFIMSHHMPPGAKLTDDESDALYNCLVSEYYGGFSNPRYGGSTRPGLLLKWLSEPACPDSVPGTRTITGNPGNSSGKNEVNTTGYGGYGIESGLAKP